MQPMNIHMINNPNLLMIPPQTIGTREIKEYCRNLCSSCITQGSTSVAAKEPLAKWDMTKTPEGISIYYFFFNF